MRKTAVVCIIEVQPGHFFMKLWRKSPWESGEEGNKLLLRRTTYQVETPLWGPSLGNEAKKPLQVWAKMEVAGTGHWNISLEGCTKTEGRGAGDKIPQCKHCAPIQCNDRLLLINTVCPAVPHRASSNNFPPGGAPPLAALNRT